MNATEVIVDAFERCNRLSPGESLGGDDIQRGLARLNMLVDEWAADGRFLFKDVLTSAVQTGPITLGAGSWTAIAPGAVITGATIAGVPLDALTAAQYAALASPATTGSPTQFFHDGLSTVYLYPVATGQTITLRTGQSVAEFADATTQYTVPPGYKSALGAALAVRVAPYVGGVTPALLKAETAAMARIAYVKPSIVDTGRFGSTGGNTLTFFNG